MRLSFPVDLFAYLARFIEKGTPPVTKGSLTVLVTKGILMIAGLETLPQRPFQDKALASNTLLFLDGILLLHHYVDEAIRRHWSHIDKPDSIIVSLS